MSCMREAPSLIQREADTPFKGVTQCVTHGIQHLLSWSQHGQKPVQMVCSSTLLMPCPCLHSSAHLCIKVLFCCCLSLLLVVVCCCLQLCLHVSPHSSISSSNRLQESLALVKVVDAAAAEVPTPAPLNDGCMVVKVCLCVKEQVGHACIQSLEAPSAIMKEGLEAMPKKLGCPKGIMKGMLAPGRSMTGKLQVTQ